MTPCLLLLLTLVVGSSTGSVQSEFEACVSEGLGQELLVCDTDHVLSNSTNHKLTSLLKDMQSRIPCECSNGCTRSNGNDKYLGVMLVTNSSKLEGSGKTLNETANDMYKALELGNAQCHNGLFIVYIKDKQQLATYRGPTSFMLLKQSEMSKLHNLAAHQGEDDTAMQYLLSNYDNVAMRSDIQRAETWTPMVGLWVALMLVLLILALLLALFLARFCCCCARSVKEDTYRVGPVPTYTTIQPLFIAPPPPPPHDQIYSTPYSGTPIPPPHVGVSRMDTYRGSMHSATLSQSATPASTHNKHRIRPVPRGTTPIGTPTARSARDSQFDDTMIMDSEPLGHIQRNSTSSMPQGAVLRRPSQEMYGVQRAVGNGDHDLAFLDPNRKQEVQTRTDFIY